MQNAGTLPRGPFDNATTASYASVNRDPWRNLYEGLSNVADGLYVIEQGMRFIHDGADMTDRARAYGKFAQGVLTGWLGIFYDQAIIFDEHVLANLEQEAPLPVPYAEVMAKAMEYFEESIRVAESAAPFRLPGGEIVARLAAPAAPNGLAAREEVVWVSGRDQPFILELNARTFEIVRTLTVGGRPQELVLPPDGELLYIANEAGYVQIWDLEANAELRRVDLPGGGGFAMAQNPTNGRLYVSTGYFSRSVWVINPENGHIARHILTGGTPRRIAFTAGGLGIVPNEWGWVDFIR